MSSSRGGVVLIGLRGAGKTTVGRLLAGRLGLPFVDVDEAIAGETGRCIADLMRDGVFRGLEAEMTARVLGGEAAVVALGGGAVLWDGLQAALAAAPWRVVWLDAAPDVLAARIRDDRSGAGRPSLTGRPPDEEVVAVASQRAALYAAVAQERIATDDRTPREVAALLSPRSRTRSRDAD